MRREGVKLTPRGKLGTGDTAALEALIKQILRTGQTTTQEKRAYPVPRGATYNIVGLGTEQRVVAQADATCNGVNDAAVINDVLINRLTSGRTFMETVKLTGIFTLEGWMTVPSYTRLDLTEAILNHGGATTSTFSLIRNYGQDFSPVTANNNIEIVGGLLNGDMDTVAGGYGIYMLNVNDLLIQGVTVHDCEYGGMMLESLTNFKVLNNYGYDCGVTAGSIISVRNRATYQSTAKGVISNNVCLDPYSNCIDAQAWLGGTVKQLTISNNVCMIMTRGQIGICIDGGVHRSTITGNTVHFEWASGDPDLPPYGISMVDGYSTGGNTYNAITGNIIEGSKTVAPVYGIWIQDNDYNSATGNLIDGCTKAGILLYRTKYNRVVGNEITNVIEEAIKVSDDGADLATYNIITGNSAHGGTYGIRSTNSADYNVVVANDCSGSTANINLVGGHNTVGYNGGETTTLAVTDTFTDVVAESATAIINAQTAATATPFTFTLAGQPDVPRMLSLTLTHANITAYTIIVRGIDARDNAIEQTLTEADGWTANTLQEYKTVVDVRMTTRTGTGVGDTLSMGTRSRLGLSYPILGPSDVTRVTKNGSDMTVNTQYTALATNAAGNVSNVKVDHATAIVTGDDFVVYYNTVLSDLVNFIPKSVLTEQGDVIYASDVATPAALHHGTALTVLQSGGHGANPAWSTATYPATTTVSQLLYSSSANVVAGLATDNSSILVTSAGGVPSWATTLPAFTFGGAVTANAQTLGTLGTTTIGNNIYLQWNNSTGTAQNIMRVGSDNALYIYSPTGLLQFNSGIAYDAYFFSAVGTGRVFGLTGTTTAAGGPTTSNSATLEFGARYWSGANTKFPATIIETMDATTPAATLKFSVNAVYILGLNNVNGATYGLWQTNVAFGSALTTATAKVHLAAGSATAATAPLKFTSGVVLTAPEAGAMEFVTDTLSFTITTGAARKTIAFTDSTLTGIWNGTAVAANYGGTGVANGAGSTITLGGAVTFAGAFATTLTVTAATGVTLPTTGTLATLAGTETFSNKRTTPRITTIASAAEPTINTDNCDAVTITALAAAITSMTTNLTGTPANFDKLIIRIKDDATARAITWGAKFVAKGVALPTTTVLSKLLTVGFIYDSVLTTWGCVASAQEA